MTTMFFGTGDRFCTKCFFSAQGTDSARKLFRYRGKVRQFLQIVFAKKNGNKIFPTKKPTNLSDKKNKNNTFTNIIIWCLVAAKKTATKYSQQKRTNLLIFSKKKRQQNIFQKKNKKSLWNQKVHQKFKRCHQNNHANNCSVKSKKKKSTCEKLLAFTPLLLFAVPP